MATYSAKNRWIDPLKGQGGSGVLLSDQIAYYAGAVNLIDPFLVTFLRPASYDLTVGDQYWVNDNGKPLRPGESITIPSNGLAYIRTRESLNMPYYLIARYSLRVRQTYRGLLVDNGLQVDPGYRGTITVPVHNLTNGEKKLEYGEAFLSVDFTRTTEFRPTILEEVISEEDFLDHSGDLKGLGGEKLVLFWKSREAFMKPTGVDSLWITGETHKSSLEEMHDELEKVTHSTREQRKELTRSKQVGYIALIGLVIALFGALVGNVYLLEGKYSAALEKIEEVRSEIKVLEDHDSRAREVASTVQDLTSRVKILESSAKPSKR